MNYPQYPQPQYPQQPQPQYPPPQYPQQPQQPAQYPQGQPYYPPPQQQGPPPPPRGTIDDFYNQPAASGKSISFDHKVPGTSYTGVVIRNLTNADVSVQTDMITRQPARHPDGSIKRTLVIPLQMQPSAEFPDGIGSWYCKANDRPELERAMQEAGLPHGSVPQQGGILTVTFTREVQTRPGLNPRKEKHITYQPPAGAAASPQPAIVEQPVQNGQAAMYPTPAGVQGPIPPPQYAPQPAAPPVQPAPAIQQPQNPADLSPAQLELLARLQGQQQ